MGLDWTILDLTQKFCRCDFLDFIMPKITMLGNSGLIWIFAAVLLICVKKYRRFGFILLIGLAVGFIIGNGCLKPLIARERPCFLNPNINLLISAPTDYSFPSGHTLSSVIATVTLIKTDKRFGFAAALLCSMIAFSRLYLYVHFPSDILGGIFIGVAIGKIVIAVFEKSRRFSERKIKSGEI